MLSQWKSKRTSTAISQHQAQVVAITEQEQELHAHHQFKANLSETAREACEIVDRIRTHQRVNFWRPAAHHGRGDVNPDMPVQDAGDLMANDEVFKIVRRMPKGALLHVHLEALTSLPWLLDQALSTPGIGIQSSESLVSRETEVKAKITFRYINKSIGPRSVLSISSGNYVPGTFIPVKRAIDNFLHPQHQTLKSFLCDKIGLRLQHIGLNERWARFQSNFALGNSILFYEPIFIAAMNRCFTNLHSSGICHVELRLVITHPYYPTESLSPAADMRPLLATFMQTLNSFRAVHPTRNSFTASILLCIRRDLPEPPLPMLLSKCISYKRAFPSLICGVDLVGYEISTPSLYSLLPQLLAFQTDCAAANVNLPFVFHAGEVLTPNAPAADNIREALLLGSRRLGHAPALAYRPLLVGEARQKDITVEVCPVSNEILGLCEVRVHPAQGLLNMGVHIVLATDDPALFWTSGGEVEDEGLPMAREMWATLMSWEGFGLAGLGACVVRSLEACYVEESRRLEMKQQFAAQWESFCKWIVDEYKDLYTGE